MAVRALRSKLSERIFTHVIEDARIMQHSLVNGTPPLAPQGTKIAPLAKSGPSLIHGRRNFCSSGPPGTKTISKMDSGNKGCSGLPTETRSGAEVNSSSLRSRLKEITDIFVVCGMVFGVYTIVATNLSTWRIYRITKALDEAE